MRRLVTALAATGALLLAAAAPAGAAQVADFKVEVKGVQKNTWERKYAPQFACDVGLDGSGKETWRFRSEKPVRMRAIRTRRGVFFVGRRGSSMVPLTGTVTRTGTMNVISGAVCAEGDGTGGQSTEPPKCGTEVLASWVNLEYDSERPSVLTLDDPVDHEGDKGGGDTFFPNCPYAGMVWPNMLSADWRTHRPIGQRLPADDLFGHGKSIVIARGRLHGSSNGLTTTTTIRWEVSLTRIGGAR
jgi:hypothetical protein